MKLEPGEIICDGCNGIGYDMTIDIETSMEVCPKCFGNKKLNWTENIFGKEKYEFPYFKDDIDRKRS